MYALFNNPPVLTRGGYNDSDLDYALEQLRQGTDRWIDYRRTHPAAVDSQHLLNRLLTALPVAEGTPQSEYYNQIDLWALTHAAQFGLTTAFSRGRLHGNLFYGPDTQEIILAASSGRIPSDPWWIWEPIRVLSHPRSDLTPGTLGDLHPSGGMAVIQVDIPLLACQYRHWLASTHAGPPEARLESTYFLQMVPLTTAIRSHLDVALLNRFKHHWKGLEPDQSVANLPIYIPDVRQRIDIALERRLRLIMGSPSSMLEILTLIPAVYRPHAQATIALPSMPFTSQVLWAVYLARLHVVAMLVSMVRLGHNERARPELITISRSLQEAQNAGYLRNILTGALGRSIEQYIADEIQAYL